MTTRQMMDALTKDFLERDGNTFVRIRRTDRLGWEETLPEDTAYSEMMLHPKTEEDLYKNAHALARDMIIAMNTPYKVNVRLSADMSCTNGRNLYVATKVFDDPDLSLGKKLDAFTGLAVHEGCHLLYTDFSATAACSNSIIHNLQNIIEDERIERNCGEDMPGLANFLCATKYYYFDKYRKDLEKTGQTQQLNTFTRLMNCILGLIRYPKSLVTGDLEEFAEVLLKVRALLIPYPKSTAESIACAEKIYALIEQYYKDEENGQNEQQRQRRAKADDDAQQGGEGQPDGSPQEGDPSDGQQQGAGQSSGTDDKQSGEGGSAAGKEQGDTEDEDNPGSAGEEDTDGTEDNAECSDANGDKDSTEKEAEPEDGRTDEEKMKDAIDRLLQDQKQIEKLLEELSKAPTEGEHPDRSQMSRALQSDPVLAMVCEGSVQRGVTDRTILAYAEDNRDRYNESLGRVRRYIPAIARILTANSTEYKFSLKGMRSGLLDTTKLAEARQGVQNVYVRQGEVRSDKVCVGILIDESGSMWGEKEKAARDTAVLLNEAIGRLRNVELFIYGYDGARTGALLRIYRDTRSSRRYALGSTTNGGGTPTGEAILEARSQIRRQSGENCLLFVISDGCPNDESLVVSSVKAVEKDGMQVIGISIDSSLDERTLSRMYTSHVTLTDMGTLAMSLGKVVRKSVLKNTAQRISL